MRDPIVLSEAAREDIGRAVRWYRERSERLAREFLADVESCLEGLSALPMRHPISHRDVRRARLRRFPYMVLYTIRRERVHAFGVFHLHPDPRQWMARRE